MKLQPLKEAYKASTIPIFQVIWTKNIEMAAKIPWPASNGTSPLLNICFYIIDLYSNGGGGEWPMLRDCDICTNKMFLTRIYLLGPLNCLNSHFFSDQLFQTKLSIPKNFCTQFFGTQHVLYSKCVGHTIFLVPNFYWIQNV